jgi:hypothetical protein
MLDGGGLLQLFVFGIAAFWGAVIILRLRGKEWSSFDIAFVRSGTLPVCFVSILVTNAV